MLKITLKDRLPEPTFTNPYAQLDFIFHHVANEKNNPNTQSNYKNALTFYKNFIKETNNYDSRLDEDPRFYLNKYWDTFALIKVSNFIKECNTKERENYLSSYTIVTHFSAIRNVMEEAVNLKLSFSKDIFIISIGSAVRETENNTAYSQKELDNILEALRVELEYSYRVLKKVGYKKTGVGNDPRGFTGGNKSAETGWGNIDNFRWYFENVLNCKPILGTSENKQYHKSFVEYAPRKYFKHLGGLAGIYRTWGVTFFLHSEVIMPLVMKLAFETGLNPDSIYDLDIDCFGDKHPLSGVPYLKYYKLRSGGEKEMHLSQHISSKNIAIKEYRHNQAEIIKKTIQNVIDLTCEIRKKAPKEISSKLFLFEAASQKCLGQIGVINSNVSSTWCKSIIKKYGLKSDKGKPLKLSISRFRPTRITRLVEKGIDVYELQHEMGHNNIRTTLKYIEINQLNYIARKNTTKALDKIFKNLSWAEKEKPEYASLKSSSENVIYKGIVCDCKNPFNPPEEVKKLDNYTQGQVCSRYNMCFFCHNVLVFKKHLPLAWVYKKQIELALSNSKNDLPNELFYRRTLDVIEHLFDPEKSEFNDEDLAWAREVAENMDELIDPVTYIPVS